MFSWLSYFKALTLREEAIKAVAGKWQISAKK